ncbi:hypothetical protein D187_003277 [Cystobacter fuscus DSM 2262]|uniref:Uncharacterized protein n=1 Tax=Cystobacter fuscus (strain ATCC 25194 / DSM 2262 / NBRC 100088 / M29) TaxID=1242864 RepID=S9PNG0_CYSF2|nr:hypothetical protein D187_003277 [Cystobacter fuscus DSM 2262]
MHAHSRLLGLKKCSYTSGPSQAGGRVFPTCGVERGETRRCHAKTSIGETSSSGEHLVAGQEPRTDPARFSSFEARRIRVPGRKSATSPNVSHRELSMIGISTRRPSRTVSMSSRQQRRVLLALKDARGRLSPASWGAE